MTNYASGKHYELDLNVWKSDKMKVTKDLYVTVDVLLLACVFKTFRKESVDSFKLDLLDYISTSGYSWDAMEKFNGIRLKQISDIEKYQLKAWKHDKRWYFCNYQGLCRS